MSSKRHQWIVAILLATFGVTAAAQTDTLAPAPVPQEHTDTLRLSCQAYLNAQGLDTSMVNDTAAFRQSLLSLPGTYLQQADSCERLGNWLGTLEASLSACGTVRDSVLWFDSAACYVDYHRFAPLMRHCAAIALHQATLFRQLEQERLEQERLEQERQAQLAAQLRRDSIEAHFKMLREHTVRQGERIDSICNKSVVSPFSGKKIDGSTKKILKDIYFSYLAFKMAYNTTGSELSEADMTRLTTLDSIQRHLLDTVLGPGGYPARIEAFPAQLNILAGSEHSSVKKSYNRAMKDIKVNYKFGDTTEYSHIVHNLREILAVQEGYKVAIGLRDSISSGTNRIRNYAGKQRKEVWDSYRIVAESLNLVPAFTSVEDRDVFLNNLRTFLLVQEEYVAAIDHINAIHRRGDSIVGLRNRQLADVVQAYNTLCANTNFVPNFGTLDGARFFHDLLNDFEQLQDDYLQAIELRKVISAKTDTIRMFKGPSRQLLAAYKELQTRATLTPNFGTHDRAVVYLDVLDGLIVLQNKFIQANQNNLESAAAQQQIKQLSKNAKWVMKAYTTLVNSIPLPREIRSENELDKLLDMQQEQLRIQRIFLSILRGEKKADMNSKFKDSYKDATRIRSLIVDIES